MEKSSASETAMDAPVIENASVNRGQSKKIFKTKKDTLTWLFEN
jgi:hypothetical protein